MTTAEIRNLFAPETGAVILDTETTGLHDTAEIIELGIIRASTGAALYNQRFKPRGAMNPESQKIHHIGLADLSACPRFSERITDVRSIIASAPVIAWYADFDKGKLQQEFARANAPLGRCLENWHCASILYHLLAFGNSRQIRDLSAACAAEGVPPAALHTALGDSTAIRGVLLSALKTAPEQSDNSRML